MIEYVAGFAFNPGRTSVVLICKEKPNWMEGCWSAVGGKVEETDTNPKGAMIREFTEETGVIINNWSLFCVLSGAGWKCSFYRVFCTEIYNVETRETEKIAIFPLTTLGQIKKLANLEWLIAMALTTGDRADWFDIKEERYVN